MRYLYLIVTFLTCSFAFSVKAYSDYTLTVDESISDNVYLRIITDESDFIHLSINIDGVTLQGVQLDEILQYFLEEGVAYRYKVKNNKTEFLLELAPYLLDKIFNFFDEIFKSDAVKPSYVDLFILGKVNQQKMLGKVYSKWSKLETTKDIHAIYNFQYDIDPSLNKSKENYWSAIFALLLACQNKSILSSDYLITDSNFYCNLKEAPTNLSAGDIANLKSETLQWISSNISDPQKIIPLIMKFRQEQSALKLNEFFAYLENMSIENVNTIYHEIVGEELLIVDAEVASQIKIDSINPNHRDFITLTSSNIELWTLTFYLPNHKNICSLLNCEKLYSSTNFEIFNNGGQWLTFMFQPTDKEKNINILLDEVIKPLNIAKGFNNSQLIIKGPKNLQPLVSLVNSIDFSISSHDFKGKEKLKTMFLGKFRDSEQCSNKLQLGSQFLASQVMTQYYWQYLAVKSGGNQPQESINIFESSCFKLSGIGESLDASIFINEEDNFNLMKSAVLKALATVNQKDGAYFALTNYYHINPKEVLESQLESLTFQEYRYFADLVNSAENASQ